MSGPATFLEPSPHAAVFPMLPGGELQELADDIAAHGLRHPIVLDDQGRVLLAGTGSRRARSPTWSRASPRTTVTTRSAL
jgi:hypothetical protein